MIGAVAGGHVRARLLTGLLMMAVVVGLSWPMLTTSSGLTQDWPNHLWYMWRQSLNIRAGGLPSLFLNSGGAIFYPLYGFYAGGLYTLGGTLSLVLGNAPVKAYVLTWMLGLGAAYGGFYWLARMAGLGRWLSHAPAFVYVTAPYTLTLIYARGAWPEFMATSAIPLLVASSIQILRRGRLTAGPALALALSTVVFTGSHNITLLWGATFMLVGLLLAVACIPPLRRLLTRRAVSCWLLVVVPSALVNAWFLLPAVAYSSRIRIGSSDPTPLLSITSILTSPGRLFTLSRGTSATAGQGIAYTPDFVLALPVVAIGSVLVVGLLLLARRGWRDIFVRWLAICVGIGLVFVLLLTNWTLINDLPRSYRLVQFPYRLESYVLFAICAAMIAALAGARASWGDSIALRGALLAVVAVSAIGAAVQIAAYPSLYPDRNAVFDARHQPPSSLYGTGDYADATLPVIAAPGAPPANFAQSQSSGQRVRATFPVSLGQELIQTNIRGAPYFVHVAGASTAGRTQDGFVVLKLPAGHPASVTLTVERANSAPIEIGRALSFVGGLVLVGLLALLGVRAARRARSPLESAPGSSTGSEPAV